MTKKSLMLGILVIVISFAATADSMAAVTVPHMFGNNMVLQRDMPVPVWGWADQGEQITVSFGGQTKTTVAAENGEWTLRLDPLKTDRTPRDMVVTASNTVTFRNVVVGEVWLYAGQYNAPVRSALQPEVETATANLPDIRCFYFCGRPEDTPVKTVGASWNTCKPHTALHYFDSISFFFARRLFKELDVPNGMICCSSGNTPIEPWIPPIGFRSVPELKTISDRVDTWDVTTASGYKTFQEYFATMDDWLLEAEQAVKEKSRVPYASFPELPGRGKDAKTPTSLFNGIINPVIPYAIRGVIWREVAMNNHGRETYGAQMTALINSWRQLWGQGDFPFHFVQLQSYGQPDKRNPAGGHDWAEIREAQRKILELPRTGMAVSIDIGDPDTRSSKNKQDVGKRLALWAIKDFKKAIVYSGPLYSGHKVEGRKIRISFDHCGSGLMFGTKTGLEPVQELANARDMWISIAGKDKKWHWADAEIDGNTIVVSCDKVAAPVAVRYAYTINPGGVYLYNKEGLPASPFRTDAW